MWDHDTVNQDDFLGRVLIPLRYIPALVSMVTAIDSYSCIGLAMWDYLCYDSRVRAYENKPQIICKLYSAVVRFE